MAKAAFRTRVFRRAVSQTWHRAIDQKPQTIAFAAILFIFSLAATAADQGSARIMRQAYPYLIALGVWVATLGVIFLWNLWLAPYELVMEEMALVGRGGLPVAPSAPQPEPKFNFMPLKARHVWSVSDLAMAAAVLDPNAQGSRGHNAYNYTATIVDAMKHGSLNHIRQPTGRIDGGYYEPSASSQIKREYAIAWLKNVLHFDTAELE
jgi:hypothetical protein